MNTSKTLERSALTRSCLLVTFIGAGIGDVALFNEIKRWHLAPNVAKMEPIIENLIDLKFLNYFLLSKTGQREIFKHIKATAQPSLSMGTIRDIDFPLPPLTEQRAIVECVDRLLNKVDEVEQQVAERKELAEKLLQSVLREAFGGNNMSKEERDTFEADEMKFYLLFDNETEPVIKNFMSTCGVYQLPIETCKKDLINLPSPIQSPDFIAGFTTGVIPTSTAYSTESILDIIRKENNPRKFEPDYNVYRHYLLKLTNGTIYISSPQKPDHHWITSSELNKIYNL